MKLHIRHFLLTDVQFLYDFPDFAPTVEYTPHSCQIGLIQIYKLVPRQYILKKIHGCRPWIFHFYFTCIALFAQLACSLQIFHILEIELEMGINLSGIRLLPKSLCLQMVGQSLQAGIILTLAHFFIFSSLC